VQSVRRALELVDALQRARGYAVNDEETDVGVRFVGVRVALPADSPQPALVLGAPRHRLAPGTRASPRSCGPPRATLPRPLRNSHQRC
jgi:DNA-binding IclR family transcriptional regulator